MDKLKALMRPLKNNPCYPYLSEEQVRAYFGTTRQTIFNWRKSHGLPAVLAEDNRYYYYWNAVYAWAITQFNKGGRIGTWLSKNWHDKPIDKKHAGVLKQEFAFIVTPTINAIQRLAECLDCDRVKMLEIVALGLYCAGVHPEFAGKDGVKATMNGLVPKELLPLLIKGIEGGGDAEVMKTFKRRMRLAERWEKMVAQRKKKGK